jgi:hypothetical protein
MGLTDVTCSNHTTLRKSQETLEARLVAMQLAERDGFAFCLGLSKLSGSPALLIVANDFILAFI